MMLGGSFTYDSENQRALPFTVKIKELSDAMKVFAGSSSKFYSNPIEGGGGGSKNSHWSGDCLSFLSGSQKS